MVRFRQQFGRARVYVGTVRTASTPPADQWEARLDRIAELPRGWDSYNADPPSEQAVEAARAFLRFLRRGGRAPRSLNPSVVGGVGITFRRAERTVYIEFRNTGNAHAAFADEAPEPEVVRVRQDATGFAEVVAKAENFLNEQAARRDEG